MDNKLLDCLNDILVNANEVKDFIEADLNHLISDVEKLI